MADRITSPANPKLRYVRRLEKPSFRRRERRLVLEGVRLIEEALAGAAAFDFVLATDALEATDRGGRLLQSLRAAGVAHHRLEAALLDGVADTESPPGILAVVETPLIEPTTPNDLVLILDGLRDPGNLGTCLRSAWAAGATAVAVTPGTVDPTCAKAVRAAAGAHFRLPLLPGSDDRLAALVAEEDLTVWVADASGGVDYDAVDWRRPSAVVLGGEAHGPTAASAALGRRVRIPMPGGAESLNVAAAAAVLLFEASRQRRGLRARGPGADAAAPGS